MEKQRDKAARRMQRKLDHKNPTEGEPAAADEAATDDLLSGLSSESSVDGL